MATIRREETTRGPRWRVRYRRPDGSETSRRFDRAKDARDFAAKVEHDTRAGLFIDPNGPRMLFGDLVARWKAARRHGASTIPTRDSDLRTWIMPALGRYRIGQVGELELVALRNTLEDNLAASTVERVWAWVTGIFRTAVRHRLLPIDPTVGLQPARAPRREPLILEAEQVVAVLGELPAWYRVPVMCAADAGLRQGEVFGLTMARVGLRARRTLILPVERQLVTPGKGEDYRLALPKRGKTRAVPVAEALLDAIGEHVARFGPGPTVHDAVTDAAAQLVFATRAGAPVRRSSIDDTWRAAADRAGLPAKARFHDLRHHYASVLIAARHSEREVGERLGHSSVEVTERYGGLFEAADDRTRDAVAAAAARRSALLV